MARIFILLSAISVVMTLLAGGSAYWLSLSDLKQAKQDRTLALAKAVSLGISSQLNILQQSVDGFAQKPEVIEALESKDETLIKSTAGKLDSLIPFAFKIRLLLPDINELDESSVPYMGFADLEMVRETISKIQIPAIQGEGKQRHLAITSKVSSQGHVVGVLLASLKFDFIKSVISHVPENAGVIKVKQGRTVLAAVGKLDDMKDADDKISIPGSNWEILFWSDNKNSSSDVSLIISSIFIPGLMACLAFFIGYRKLAEYFRLDQSSIIKATKDLIAGKAAGNYPIQLNEMESIISTLTQYKRVIDKQKTGDIDTEFDADDGFFDEGLDTGFLDTDFGIEIEDEPNRVEPVFTATTLQDHHKEPEPGLSSSVIEDQVAPFSSENNIDHIFRAYDIRGIVDKSLTIDLVFKIGQAIGSEAKALNIKTIVVGRDGRTSSSSLSKSLTEGILSTGRDILDIGMIPTPVLYFVTHHSEGRTGIMITGSHNPADYNGLKVVINGETLATEKIQKLKHRVENNEFETGIAGSIEQNNIFTNEYIGIISDDIHIVRPMKIVLDCGNGAAGELAPVLLKTIGCEVIELYCDVDGSFPNHHPDPSRPENLQDLIAMVKHHEADVGIALDGDGDRIGIVDSNGKIIWPDRQMMLFSKDVLSAKPGSEIIFDVKCTRHLSDEIIKNGGRPLMWKTGHSLLKAKLKQTNAALAGEMSGHIIFNDRWFGFDDGLYAAARMIEILSADSRNSSEVFADLPDSINTPELTIAMEEGENFRFIDQILRNANFQDGNILKIDGMRVDFDDGWGLLRASNTTPSVVIRFEADNQDALKRIQDQFRALMLQIKPDISLPF